MISLQFLNGKEKPGSQKFIVIGIFTELFVYIRKASNVFWDISSPHRVSIQNTS